MEIQATDDPAADFLAHYGVKGMKWGQRKGPTRAEILSSRHDVRALNKNARAIRKEAKAANKAGDPKARAAAAAKYKKEVVDKIQTEEFKTKYKAASKQTKGEMAVLMILGGPLMYPAIRVGTSDKALNRHYHAEVGTAKDILEELRSID